LGALGVALVTGVAIFISHLSGPLEVADRATSEVIDSSTPVQEIAVARARRSGQPPHTEVDLTRVGSLVMAIDLDRVRSRAIYYDMVLLDFTGDEIFRDEIGEEYFDEGRFLLRIKSKHFQSGGYTIEIEGTDQSGIVSVLARGTIDVTR
jgi:hypothetical protein